MMGSSHIWKPHSYKLSSRRELEESTRISHLLVRMSNDKVVGVGGDGQSSHWKVVSRDRAVELGRKTRDKAIGHLIFLQERLDERDMVMTTSMAALQR